jgi:ABC-2 type transport system permease protein
MKSKRWFLLWFSLRRKIWRKSFFISNAIVLAIVIGLSNIDQIISFFSSDDVDVYEIYYQDAFAPGYEAFLAQTLLELDDSEITVFRGQTDIVDESAINIRMEDGFEVSIESESSIPSSLYNAIVQSMNQIKLIEQSSQYDLSLEEVMRLSTPVIIDRAILDEAVQSEEEVLIGQGTAYVITVPLFIALVFVIQMVGMEIFEEKSTKSTEIILSNVTPQEHLFAKIASANLFSWFQFLLFIVFGLLGLTSRNALMSVAPDLAVLDLSAFTDELIRVLPVVVILYIMTNITYSFIMAILSATAYEMEDFQKIISPLMITMAIGFYIGIFSIFVPDTLFSIVIAHIPLFSLFIAPALWVSGVLSWVNIVVIVLIQMALVYVLYRYGAKIYKQAILDYSGQGVFTRLWKVIRGQGIS